MEYMEMLKGKICKEIDKQAEKGGELTKESLEVIYKLSDVYKNLLKIEMLEESAENGYSGYSEDGGWMARGVYGRGNSYDGGMMNNSRGSYNDDMSYARRGGNSRGTHYVRGHYSRESGAAEDMIENLEEMMQNASSEKEREAIRKCISQIESM